MKKITIINNESQYDIIVDNIKMICGDNYEAKDKIINTFINYFSKMNRSDYADENGYNSLIKINDDYISDSNYEFFFVSQLFDLNSDLKLTSKSLCLMYITALLNNIEYNETFNTIAILLNDLLNEVSENEAIHDIIPMFESELTKKDILKLLSFSFIKEDNIINNFDLNLEEKINLQLEMIAKISSVSEKNTIVVVDSPIVYKTTFEKLNMINGIKLLFLKSPILLVIMIFYS